MVLEKINCVPVLIVAVVPVDKVKLFVPTARIKVFGVIPGLDALTKSLTFIVLKLNIEFSAELRNNTVVFVVNVAKIVVDVVVETTNVVLDVETTPAINPLGSRSSPYGKVPETILYCKLRLELVSTLT